MHLDQIEHVCRMGGKRPCLIVFFSKRCTGPTPLLNPIGNLPWGAFVDPHHHCGAPIYIIIMSVGQPQPTHRQGLAIKNPGP